MFTGSPGSTVTDSWGYTRYLWHLSLTQKGYIVMSVDNRGTRLPGAALGEMHLRPSRHPRVGGSGRSG